jgi:hypothetical protein
MASKPEEPQLNGNHNNTEPLPESAEKARVQPSGLAEDPSLNGNAPDTSTPKEAEKNGENYGEKQAAKHDEKQADKQAGEKNTGDDEKKEKQPEGGFDSTPLPHVPPGYTIRITFHRASNLPMADINSLSSDPFVRAQLYTSLPTRHKDDPPLIFRTPTIRRNVDPEWNTQWIVANVPSSGFRLKCRLYDEDPADHDDRLGNATILVPSLSEHWEGINNQSYKIKKRMGSKRAYILRAIAVCIKTAHDMGGLLFVSIEMLGRTDTREGGQCYTVGPMWWTKHYSPMLGRIAGRKEPGEDSDGNQSNKKAQSYKYATVYSIMRPPLTSLVSKPINYSSKDRPRQRCTTDTLNLSLL